MGNSFQTKKDNQLTDRIMKEKEYTDLCTLIHDQFTLAYMKSEKVLECCTETKRLATVTSNKHTIKNSLHYYTISPSSDYIYNKVVKSIPYTSVWSRKDRNQHGHALVSTTLTIGIISPGLQGPVYALRRIAPPCCQKITNNVIHRIENYKLWKRRIDFKLVF